jgi:hypothetical protein
MLAGEGWTKEYGEKDAFCPEDGINDGAPLPT